MKKWLQGFCCAMGTAAGLGFAIPASADANSDFQHMLAGKYELISRAYASGDDSLFRQFYAADAYVFGEGYTAGVGIEKILSVWKTILPTRRAAQVHPSRSEISQDGTLGYAVAVLDAYPKDTQAPPVHDTILTIWKKAGGDWRCISEVFVTGDRAPAGPGHN